MAVGALDVGGTLIKLGALAEDGTRWIARTPTRRAEGPDAVVDTVLAAAAALVEGSAQRGIALEAIGVAALGILDEEAGVAVGSASVGWHDVPLRRLIEDRTGRPVVLTHDARAGAELEANYGAGRGQPSLAFVPVGTGVSVALVVDGVAVPGASGRAGEVGQVRSSAAGPSTGPVTVEDVASAAAIERRYRDAVGGSTPALTAVEVLIAADAGDAAAIAVRSAAVVDLAAALAAVVTVFDPALIVVGGGLVHAGGALLAPLAEATAAALAWRSPPPIVAARFADDAGWLGAALHAWRATGRTDAAFPADA